MNRIPRTARKLDVIFLIDTTAGKSGMHMIAERTENGWHGKDDSGKWWSLLTAHLRNANLCKITIIE